jgi:hypothetical protein
MKKRIFVIGFVILITLGGGVLMLSNRKSNQESSVLSAQTQGTTAPTVALQAKPKLEIFTDGIQIKTPEASDYSKAENGQLVEVGSVLKTDKTGRAQILFPNNSVARIDFNSEITLTDFSISPQKANIKLFSGKVWNRVAKLFGKDDSFQTTTNTLVASVRGTSYGVGILLDGSNKVSVSKSKVHVDCNLNPYAIDVFTNKKITTKCTSNLKDLNWDTSDNNDEWFLFNKSEDAKLDARFGTDTYGDQSATPSATPKITPKPTIKPTALLTPVPTVTPSPTTNPTPTPTLSSTPSSTPLRTKPISTPTPTPSLILYNPNLPLYMANPTPTPINLR